MFYAYIIFCKGSVLTLVCEMRRWKKKTAIIITIKQYNIMPNSLQATFSYPNWTNPTRMADGCAGDRAGFMAATTRGLGCNVRVNK